MQHIISPAKQPIQVETRMVHVMRKPTIKLKKAYDIRQLCKCAECEQISDRRHMLRVGRKFIHGCCTLEMLGIDGLVSLPKDEIHKLTLGEIGPQAMKEICDRLATDRKD